jgi:hypothetical protein
MRCAVLLLGLAVAACSQPHVQTTSVAMAGPLPPPAHVMVSDFAMNPAEVRLDSGVGAELRREFAAQPTSATQTQIAARAQAALAQTLARKLGGYGMPVERLPPYAAPPPGTLLVQGQITSLDQGNRTRRMVIGLGAGASSISASSQLYYATGPEAPEFLISFNASADSGHMPGAAETMGAGAAAQRAAESAAVTVGTHAAAETHRTGEEALADKLAEGLARQIGEYAASRGWISKAAVN